MGSASCRSCGAPIRFATNVTTGNTMPFDAAGVEPDTAGCFAIIGGRAYNRDQALGHISEQRGVSIIRAAQILDEVGAWRVSHFSTCPDPGAHRRPRPTKGTRK